MKMPNKPNKNKTKPRPIKKVSKELTAGGVVYRLRPDSTVEFLLIQDIKGRWTVPKGHVEPGESYRQTALREITEEIGLKSIREECYLKSIEFNYRHGPKLVIVCLHLFAVEALDKTEKINCEGWIQNAAWFSTSQALDKITYKGLYQAILLTLGHLKKERGKKNGQRRL